MKKIAITTTTFAEYNDEPLKILKNKGYEVLLNPFRRKLEKNEILSFCALADGLIAGTESLDGEVLNELKSLRIISRCGVGIDNVDIEAANKLGIKVLNTPDGPTLAVAELALGLMLDTLRNISLMDRKIRSGEWEKKMGNLLSEKKVGIIGFGRIGRKTAQLLQAFDCEIKFFDPFVKNNENGKKVEILGDLLRWADIVSIHVSTKERILGTMEIDLLKKGSWIINVSRGAVIDEKALYDSLKNGRLAGAGLDVFEKEPYSGRLRELENVVITPHVGSYAVESRVKMEIEAVNNLIKGLEEKK